MSGPTLLVDDHLLLRVLVDDEPAELRPGGGALLTTGLWYHRLCRALARPAVGGALTRRLGPAGPGLVDHLLGALSALPESVGLLSLRELAWPMAALLRDGVRLNLLGLEALAAAAHADAELCLAVDDEQPALLAAAAALGRTARLIDG